MFLIPAPILSQEKRTIRSVDSLQLEYFFLAALQGNEAACTSFTFSEHARRVRDTNNTLRAYAKARFDSSGICHINSAKCRTGSRNDESFSGYI